MLAGVYSGIQDARRRDRYTYERRRPEQTVLYRIVRDNLETLFAAIEPGFASELPRFVKAELEGFLDCGIASKGSARLFDPFVRRLLREEARGVVA